MGETALSVCLVCRLIWWVFLIAGCSYVVFWLDHSGWWFLLAIILGQVECSVFAKKKSKQQEPTNG